MAIIKSTHTAVAEFGLTGGDSARVPWEGWSRFQKGPWKRFSKCSYGMGELPIKITVNIPHGFTFKRDGVCVVSTPAINYSLTAPCLTVQNRFIGFRGFSVLKWMLKRHADELGQQFLHMSVWLIIFH